MSARPGGLSLTEAQRIDWLRLTRTEGIGPLTFRELLNRYGSAGQALAALPGLLAARGKGHVRIPTVDDAERELDIARRHGARIVAMGEPDYPPLLKTVDGRPPLLAMRGSAEILRHPFVAVVGSRNASAVGKSFTDRLAKGLTEQGFGIVSGLARGIDTRAHEASIGFATIAVLAGGLDRPYPPENVPLLERIAEQGLVISEMPFGWEPRGRDFPRRNRIISGIAYGSVIVEAARRSGSLITARFALEQGREVFAVPGSPLDPRAEGTNDLLRQNATLCASVEDVVAVLRPMIEAPDLFDRHGVEDDAGTPRYQNEPLWDELFAGEDGLAEAVIPGGLSEEAGRAPMEPVALPEDMQNAAARIVAALGPSPVDIDDLARLSGVSLREVQTILLDLDLDGRIERHGGNRVSLSP